MNKKRGEFQKRVEKFSSLIEHAKTISEEDTIVLSELRKMIEEAKREFEKLIHGTWSVDEEGWHPNATAKDSWITPSEAIKWFRKWFGE